MEKDLKQKLEFICDFCNTTPTIIYGSNSKGYITKEKDDIEK